MYKIVILATAYS